MAETLEQVPGWLSKDLKELLLRYPNNENIMKRAEMGWEDVYKSLKVLFLFKEQNCENWWPLEFQSMIYSFLYGKPMKVDWDEEGGVLVFPLLPIFK